MPAPTTPHTILRDGYEVTGDVETGYTATVPYLVDWIYAFSLADELLGVTSAPTPGPISFRRPHRFPAAVADLYCQRVRITPQGVDGEAVYGNALEGLSPGEYFAKAIVLAEYATLKHAGFPDDDDNRHQLDPDHPIYCARQTVRSTGRMETRKHGFYIYDDDEKKVDGDFAVPTSEDTLQLTFERVPYNPWSVISPYKNCVNASEMFGRAAGEVLFLDLGVDDEPGPNGLQHKVELSFKITPRPGQTWNQLPKPNGTLEDVRIFSSAGSPDPVRIFPTAELWDIFDYLEFIELS